MRQRCTLRAISEPALLLVAIVALCTSCSDDERPVRVEKELGIVTSLQVRQSQIPTDGFVEFRINVVNLHSEPLEVTFDTLEQIGVEIQTPDTVLAFPCDVDSTTSHRTFPAGGGRIYHMIFWPGDVPYFCPTQADTMAVGSYVIRGGLLGHDDEYPWGMDTFTVIPQPAASR